MACVCGSTCGIKAGVFGIIAALAAGAGLVAYTMAPTEREAAPSFTPVALPGESKPFTVDAVHSSVVYRIKHMNVAYFYGTFNDVSGSFHLNKDDASTSVLDVTIKADSVDSRNGDRDKHLMSQDFFSTKEFPEITFKGKEFKKTGENALEVKGDLTFRGVTKPVTATIEDTGMGAGRRGGEVAGIEAKFTINRSDFGMTFMSGKGLGEDVTIMVSLEGARQ